MKDTCKVFYDGLENIRLTDGVIHMAFYHFAGNGNEEKREPAGEIVLSQQAFLRAFGAMESMVAQLEKAGLVKRKGPEDVKPAVPGETKPVPGGSGPAPAAGSPNFQ